MSYARASHVIETRANGARYVRRTPRPRPRADGACALQMRALFAEKDAYVFTTWSGGVPIDEFIKISEIGFSKGVKIAVRLPSHTGARVLTASLLQHRANGCTVDIATSGPAAGVRGLGKLKA